MSSSTYDKLIAVLSYILAMFFPVPILSIVAVFLFWLVFRDQSRFIDHHLKENINFQISFQLYTLAAFILVFIFTNVLNMLPQEMLPDLLAVSGFLMSVGLFGLLIFAGFAWYALLAAASIGALLGKFFKFPLIIRFVK
ncbi:DUF4870 domain-containing protein [Salsuginibacillus kocurii]|uniref:DUF4870 domain-containing protein n=1 Tax=Salsuginibacillus kocurii TaxID=427078 RepID=UPI00037E70B0|nr:DUF4870 domain-containing protein [Salsuginibacillus kocurii]